MIVKSARPDLQTRGIIHTLSEPLNLKPNVLTVVIDAGQTSKIKCHEGQNLVSCDVFL